MSNKRSPLFTRTILLVFILVFAANAAHGGLPIPTEIRKAVAYIYVPQEDGSLIPNGTGFFVGVKNADQENSFAVYLVTAAHVLKKRDSATYYPVIVIRLVKKAGGVQQIPIQLMLTGPQKNVFAHSDSTVDLAVIPFQPSPDFFDFKFFGTDLISARNAFAKLKLGVGSGVFFTGLFLQHTGEQHNESITRFGRVALIPEERIKWNDGLAAELLLIESFAFGGSSGSPVFFWAGAEREPGVLTLGTPILRLIGIIRGHFIEPRPIAAVDTSQVAASIANVGISAIVPAEFLTEILNSDELKTRRGFDGLLIQ